MAVETYLQAVNSVLKRLREGTVTTVDQSEYAQMIGEFVQQAKDEVSNAWDWLDLRTTIQITTVNQVFDYTLPGAGRDFNVLQVHEDTLDYDLEKARSYQWMNRLLLTNNPTYDSPKYWDRNGRDGNGDPIVNFWPIPDIPYLVNFNLKIVEPLDTESSRLQVAPRAIVLRAHQLAVQERGDDGGFTSAQLGEQASSAIADAVSLDANMYPDAEAVWYVE